MGCYTYRGADVIGYFEDSKGRTQVLTTEAIYEDSEVDESKKWIRENLRHLSKKQLENYINNYTDGYLLWEGIEAQYFKKEKKKKKMVKFDTSKKVGAEMPDSSKHKTDAEMPDSSKHRTDADRDYYWPLGEIELEEVQF